MSYLPNLRSLAETYWYNPIELEPDEEEKHLMNEQTLLPTRKKATFTYTLPWIISTVVFASLSMILYIRNRSSDNHLGTYETGFETDFAAARHTLDLKQVQFYGGISVASDGSFYMSVNPDEPQYVGHPTPEMDKAWEDLIALRYIGLSHDEAMSLASEDFWGRTFNNTYWAAPDVLHTLHCVDYLRKSVDLEYYPQILIDKPNLPNHRMHLDHCLELLRQTVACYADITPVPRPYANERVGWLSNTDRMHTCRNLDNIREWVVERAEEDQIRQSKARTI